MYGSLSGFKDFVGVTSTTLDAAFTAYLTLGTSFIDTFTGRTLAQAPYAEYHSGHGKPVLLLKNRPVAPSGLAVYVDANGYSGQGTNAFAAETLQTAGSNYYLSIDDSVSGDSRSGALVWISGVTGPFSGGFPLTPPGVLTPGVIPAGWPVGQGNIKVTYTGGYATIPNDIVQANYLYAQSLNAMRLSMGFQLTGGTIGPYTFRNEQLKVEREMAVTFRTILSKYMEVPI